MSVFPNGTGSRHYGHWVSRWRGLTIVLVNKTFTDNMCSCVLSESKKMPFRSWFIVLCVQVRSQCKLQCRHFLQVGPGVLSQEKFCFVFLRTHIIFWRYIWDENKHQQHNTIYFGLMDRSGPTALTPSYAKVLKVLCCKLIQRKFYDMLLFSVNFIKSYLFIIASHISHLCSQWTSRMGMKGWFNQPVLIWVICQYN